ncbi:MAG: hypothetical protein FE047_01130 [Thermoplasmata archaeon]|nr:MAG: hypothetical protein FE047_01130 [Thermoplasmata archaeon]
MDNVTVTILAILSFLLVWLGIMIFTTKPEEKEEEQKEVQEESQPVSDEIERYKQRVAELERKLRKLEEKPANDKLLEWLTELHRENEFLRMKLSHLEGGRMHFEGESLKYENDKLKKEIEEYRARIEKLENEVKELRSSLNYYRDLVSKLQGSYTVLNKYNYRLCIRDVDTGEYHYELVKLPPDFDPFNPTYITRDGFEVYEEYGIRIPTKLGDIIREEFKKDMYLRDFELGK